MWFVRSFSSEAELLVFLRTGFTGGVEVPAANIKSVYCDAANGRHVLVYHT